MIYSTYKARLYMSCTGVGGVGGGGETNLMKGPKFYYPRGLLRPNSGLEYMEIGNEIR